MDRLQVPFLLVLGVWFGERAAGHLGLIRTQPLTQQHESDKVSETI
jgi:hypothetical protein